MSIQPDECIGLQFNAKVPGPVIAISRVGMTFKPRGAKSIAALRITIFTAALELR